MLGCMEIEIALCQAQPVPVVTASGELPDWVHLVPAGTFRGASPNKAGPWTLHDAAAVIEASMADGPLAIDENHAIDLTGPKGGPSPARGWITELQARDDGIWGRVEWTETGRALIADRAYRGISPVIQSERGSGRVVRVLRASLTNTPNLPLTTLHSDNNQEIDMDPEQLRAALGLAADADEAAILAAIDERNQAIEQHSADLRRVAEAAGLEKAKIASPDNLVTHLQTVQAEAGDVGTLRQTVIELQSQLDTLQADTRRTAAEAAIDAAIADGKPIRALRDHYITRHMADPDGVAKELGAMVSLHDGGIVTPPSGSGTEIVLNSAECEVADKMGIPHAKFLETKKRRTGATTTGD